MTLPYVMICLAAVLHPMGEYEGCAGQDIVMLRQLGGNDLHGPFIAVKGSLVYQVLNLFRQKPGAVGQAAGQDHCVEIHNISCRGNGCGQISGFFLSTCMAAGSRLYARSTMMDQSLRPGSCVLAHSTILLMVANISTHP